MRRQQIFSALNAKFDSELAKRGSMRRGLAGLTGMHLELFAGCGRHTKSLHRLGLPCLSFDYLTDPVLGDLLKPHVQACILGWIRDGLFATVWLGTPSTSWCIALNRFPKCRLRSADEIFGLSTLNDRQQQRVLIGNRTARFSIKVINTCMQLCLPVALENPCRSLLFALPGLRTNSRHKAYTRHQFTMCAFGTRWRKATELWCWYCEGHYLDTCRCTGRSGICSFSKKPHIQLQGKSDSGLSWTTIASAYPPRLCHFTARMMATAALDRSTADPGITWKKRKAG